MSRPGHTTDLTALACPGAEITVRVTPRAARAAVELAGNQIRVAVTAVPEDGKANRAVTRLLAQALGIAPSRLVLMRGAKSRDKTFRID